MILVEWARELGIKPVTLKARVRRGLSVETCLFPGNLSTPSASYRTRGGKYEHRLVAERAMGKPLPPKALVHHVDGNPSNNARRNLVVCPNDAYHRLLHMRQEALDATGDAGARKCAYCNVWSPAHEVRIDSMNRAYHRECHNDYHRERRQLRKRRFP